MSGVSRDQPPIPYGKAEKGDDTEWTIRGRRSIKVPVVMLGKAYEFSKATPTTLRTLVTNVWNKTFGVEISYTESYKEAGKKKERISTVRVSYGEIARFLGKSVFALRVEVWRKNNIQELVRQEMAKSESTGIQSLGPVQLRHYIESLMETDDDAFSKTAAFLNSLDGTNMTTKPQELTVQLLKYLPIKAHQTIAKTAYAHATSSLYAADLFVKGLDAPELAQHIKTLAAGDSIRLSKTVKFLNGLRPSGMRAAPEAVAEELMKILPEDKRTILAQELSKNIQPKKAAGRSGRQGAAPTPNLHSQSFLKAFVTDELQKYEASIKERNLEGIMRAFDVFRPIALYTPTQAKAFINKSTVSYLKTNLDEQSYIALGREITFNSVTNSKDLEAIWRNDTPDVSLVKQMCVTELMGSFVEGDVKRQKEEGGKHAREKPAEMFSRLLTQANQMRPEACRCSRALFSKLYHMLLKKGQTQEQAKSLVFNVFILRISKLILLEQGVGIKDSAFLSQVGKGLCEYQRNADKTHGKKEKLENDSNQKEKLEAYEIAARLWKSHGKEIGEFIEKLIRPPQPAQDRPSTSHL